MVRVAAFSIEDLQLIFRSSDHLPPHFHARKGAEWEIRVFIDTSTRENGLDYNYKFPKTISRKFRGLPKDKEQQLLESVIKYRRDLLVEWQMKVSSGEIV